MIEFLFWEGCPSHERALAQLREQMQAFDLPESDLTVIEVKDAQDAQRERFVGSPTIRIDGTDLSDPRDLPYGLECRLYYHRDGRPSPLPDQDDLREALDRYASSSK